jgi:hypothetical protein
VSYPGIVQDFQHTFSVLRALPCDVFLGAHGGYFDMLSKLKRYPLDGPGAFIDPAGYKDFVADSQEIDHPDLSDTTCLLRWSTRGAPGSICQPRSSGSSSPLVSLSDYRGGRVAHRECLKMAYPLRLL